METALDGSAQNAAAPTNEVKLPVPEPQEKTSSNAPSILPTPVSSRAAEAGVT